MQRRGGLSDRCHTRPRRSAKEEKIATRSNPIDRALKTHKSRSRMVSAAILAVGVLVVLAVLLSPGRRRERAAGELAFGDDSTTVLERMGDSPRRCPTGTLEHVYDAFEGAIPRQTREAVLERMRRETATRWIYPGRNGSSSPYLCPGGAVARAQQLWTNATWNSSGAETNDYGAIALSCDLGNTTGYFGWTSSGHSVGTEVDTQGYPADKPSGTQWDADNCSTSASGTVQCTITATTSQQLFYKNDTFGGQSGSPLFRVTSTGCTCAIGIHAYGLHGSSLHSTNNHGTRVNSTVSAFFSLMRNGGLV